jgi:diaminopimelate decarboxylase
VIVLKDFLNFFSENILESNRFQLKCELGRSVVGVCGDIITKVLYKKPVNGHEMLVVDASMTELIRPALYNSFHKIESFVKNRNTKEYSVVGPICESSDVFGTKVQLPELFRGDLLRIRTCGAYAESMASNYNLRPIAKSYFSDEIRHFSKMQEKIEQEL